MVANFSHVLQKQARARLGAERETQRKLLRTLVKALTWKSLLQLETMKQLRGVRVRPRKERKCRLRTGRWASVPAYLGEGCLERMRMVTK